MGHDAPFLDKRITWDDKNALVIAALFGSLFYLWVHASRLVFNILDFYVVYGGTFGLLCGPVLGFMIARRRSHG